MSVGKSANAALRWHDRYPFLGKAPLPVDGFTSTSQFVLERDLIFRKTWLKVGRVEQLPRSGEYFVHDIPACSASIIVVRSRDDSIRAFHNVCSHRGNKILWNSQGACEVFSCKLHGWSYALDGSLRSVPDEASFFDLEKKSLGLTPVALDLWEGFIFINLDPAPEQSLRDFLGELGASLAGYPFERLSATSASWTTEVRANWKLVKDGFQEVYHVPFLHRRSIPDSFTSTENPYAHLLHMELLGPHARVSLFGNAGLQPTPVAGQAFRHGSFAVRSDYSEARLPAGVNPTRSAEWSFDLNVIFPAFIVSVSESSYFTHEFWPVAVDRTIWKSTQYFPKATTAGQRFSQEYGHVLFRDVILEDGRILEETQAVMGSGAKQSFVLHDEELLIRHSHHEVSRRISAAALEPHGRATRKEQPHG